MIEGDELRAWVVKTGTSLAQVRKDHLVSHLLHGLQGRTGFVFFGGTALNRTFVAGRRLSEDIDLYREHDDPASPDDMIEWLTSATRRDFPELRIDRSGASGDVLNFTALADDLSVRVQVGGPRYERTRLPVAACPVEMRYSDLPTTADILVPTVDSFTAMKLSAYEDRFVARDLFDLGSLSDLGAIRPAVLRALRDFRGYGPTRWAYDDEHGPSDDVWMMELVHQTGDPGDAKATLGSVRASVGAAANWPA